MHLKTISLHPINCHLRKEINNLLATTLLQVAVESDGVSSQPPLLHIKQSQFPLLSIPSAPHNSCFTVPPSALLIFSEHASAIQYASSSEGTKAEHNIQGAIYNVIIIQ